MTDPKLLHGTYMRSHQACPQCGGTAITRTCVGILTAGEYRDTNKATCPCGWNGIVHDLKRPKDALK